MALLKDLIEKPITGEWGTDGEEIYVLRTTNFTNSGVLDFTNVVKRNISKKKVEQKKLQVGDVIIEKSGGSPKQPVGRVVFFDVEGVYLCNNFTSVLRPKKDKVVAKYLHYLLYASHKFGVTGMFQNKTTGIINLQLPRYINKLEIPLPPLKTQKHIAAILDDAAALRDKTAQLLTEYDLLAQSIFLEMFGDPGTNSKKLKFEEFGNHINVLTDYHANGSYKILSKNVELFTDKNYALMVRTTDLENNNFENGVNYISEKAYNFLSKSKVLGGEIIINKIGSAGKVYLMPYLNRPVSLGMNAFMLRLSPSMNNLFVFYYLQTKYGKWQIDRKVKGAVTKTIRKDAVRAIPIPVPPIEFQNEFAEKIALIEQQKALAKQELQESEDLFNCLLQKAFKGELV